MPKYPSLARADRKRTPGREMNGSSPNVNPVRQTSDCEGLAANQTVKWSRRIVWNLDWFIRVTGRDDDLHVIRLGQRCRNGRDVATFEVELYA
jgi:hypothetical protein